jgi:23S rRNA pseudouridine1911/1915/1917 synthase
MTNTLHFTPTDSERAQRLDKVITDRLATAQQEGLVEVSRAKVQQLIKEGHVMVNGAPEKASYRLDAADQVSVNLVAEIVSPPDINANVQAEAMPLSILYEDTVMVAIDKPAGMVVHPAAGHQGGTLVNALLAKYPEVAAVGGQARAGIVHRLDKDTSGVILIARAEPIRLALMKQFAARTVQKRYLALVEGIPNTSTGEINAPLNRDPNKRKLIAVIPLSKGGRPSISHFRVLERFGTDFSLVEVLPKTGRTHQIRVHMAFINCPIVGDRVYGHRRQRLKLGRHFLHAESLTVQHPRTKESVTFQAPLPPELDALLVQLRKTYHE